MSGMIRVNRMERYPEHKARAVAEAHGADSASARALAALARRREEGESVALWWDLDNEVIIVGPDLVISDPSGTVN